MATPSAAAPAPSAKELEMADPGPGATQHRATAERLELLPWGDGSAPSLPSVDNGSNFGSDHGLDAMVDADAQSSTMSITSSIYHFVEENGRTYHKYKDGRYHLPNDAVCIQEEQDRLDLQHACFLVGAAGKLYLAPIDHNIRNVLDIGTGTGIWAIEFAQLFPDAHVIGTDLSPIQPEYVPLNCTFEIEDAEEDWGRRTKFDYIHGRALLSCFDNPSFVIRQAFHALAPGGYLEYQDGVFPMGFIGDTPPGSKLDEWNQRVVRAAAAMGRDWGCALNYKRWFEEAGFQDVVEKRFYWPSGPWAKGQYYKNLGAFTQEDLLRGVEPLSIRLFSVLGYTAEQTKAFCDEVREDIKNPKTRAYVQVIFVWGRKPGVPASTSGQDTPVAGV